MFTDIIEIFTNYLSSSGFGQFQIGNLIMILVGCVFIYLAIKKGFEPLLLVPIGFGVLIGNIPFNSNELSLSVYDGPVSSHDLIYYEVEAKDTPDSLVLAKPYSDTDVKGAGQENVDTLAEALAVASYGFTEARKAERLRDLAAKFRKEGDSDKDARESATEAVEADENLKVDVNHEVFTEVINRSSKIEFDSVTRLTGHIDAVEQLDDGKAIMVNTHSLLSVSNLPEDFQAPGIYYIGQGRSVFVEELRPQDNKYPEVWSVAKQDVTKASVFWWLFAGVGLAGFYPPLIFLGVGAMIDFGPMLSRPKTLLLGAAAQIGIFGALLAAVALFGFTDKEAGSIGIIGGADGPTAIFTCSTLAPHLLGAVALAAYSYMAMVPIIQPPIMRLLTTKEERVIRMVQAKPVSKRVKIIFPVVGFLLTAFIANGALPLLGMLFFGNLLRECGVTERLSKTAQNDFINIVTILLGVTVGAKTNAQNFLTKETIFIFVLGIVAFAVATATGVLFAKAMNKLSTKDKINPLIGAAGVSAVPMAARVVHRVGQEEDPGNFLMMHAMGPNVAGVLGSAVAAGVLLSKLAGH